MHSSQRTLRSARRSNEFFRPRLVAEGIDRPLQSIHRRGKVLHLAPALPQKADRKYNSQHQVQEVRPFAEYFLSGGSK